MNDESDQDSKTQRLLSSEDNPNPGLLRQQTYDARSDFRKDPNTFTFSEDQLDPLEDDGTDAPAYRRSVTNFPGIGMDDDDENKEEFTPRSSMLSFSKKRRPVKKPEIAPRRTYVSKRNKTENLQNSAIKSNVQKKKENEIKLTLTRMDKISILLYHMWEPILLGAIVGQCLQLPDAASSCYMLVTFCGLIPLLLTDKLIKIKLKRVLTWIMVCISNLTIVLKTVFYTQNVCETDDKVCHIFGVYQGDAWKTFATDCFVFLLAVPLVIVYNDHLTQADKRLEMLNKQEYQTKVKLLHPAFGRQNVWMMMVTLVFYLADACILQTVVQFMVLIVILLIIFAYNFAEELIFPMIKGILRFLQIMYYFQGILSFIVLMPGVWNENLGETQAKVYHLLGFVGYDTEETQFEVAFRLHYVTLSVALIMTEAYIVSLKVKTRSPRQNLDDVEQKDAQRKESKEEVNDDQSEAERIDQRLSTQIEADGFLTTAVNIWHLSGSVSVLWVCRINMFIWAYMFHDWQSVIVLLWVLHSLMFDKVSRFNAFNKYFYLPIFTLQLLFYYVINIYTLIPWEDHVDDNIEDKEVYWCYGFYKFNIPLLNVGFLVFSITCFTCYIARIDNRTHQQILADKNFTFKFFERISTKRASSIYQIGFLLLVYVEYPLMFLLVLTGLDKMDVFHITLLMFFLFYMLSPELYKRNSFVFLAYVNLFVLEKYIYTLLHVNPQNVQLLQVIGATADYEPDQDDLYFRYKPSSEQWMLVFLTFVQYRRQMLLGVAQKRLRDYEYKCKHILFQKYRTFYKAIMAVNIGLNHMLVLFSFFIFLLMLIYLQETLLNCITQTIVLALLCIYMANGISKLVQYWNILIFYQAFVLTSQIIYQFSVSQPMEQLLACDDEENLNTKSYCWIFRGETQEVLGQIGYYRVQSQEDKLWKYFIFYVLMFALAVFLQKKFRKKMWRETSNLQNIFKNNEESNSSLIEVPQVDPQKILSTVENEGDKGLDMMNVSQRSINSEAPSSRKSIVEQFEAPVDQTFENRTEAGYSFTNFGKLGSKQDEVELRNYQEYQNMKFKVTYMVYKMKPIWGVLDIISEYFHLVCSTMVLFFAIYVQISVVWAIELTIFLIQSFNSSNQHFWYRDQQDKMFQERNKNQALLMDTSDALIKRNHLSKKKSQTLKKKRITIEIDDSESSRTATTNRYSAVLQEPRLIITDEEAIMEWNSFKKSIKKITLPTRHHFWVAQFVLVIITLTCIYSTRFLTFGIQDSAYEGQFVFGLFWLGLYQGSSTNVEFWSSAYPFYILLVLLIFEKLSQRWFQDKFECTDEEIEVFQQITKRQNEWKEQFNTDRNSRSSYFLTSQERNSGQIFSEDWDKALKQRNESKELSPIDEKEELKTASGDKTFQQNSKKSSINQSQSSSMMTNSVRIGNSLAEVRKESVSSQLMQSQHSVTQSAAMNIKTAEQTADQQKKELIERLKPQLEVKSKVQVRKVVKSILEAMVILLVWISTIYKQNIFSLVLFVVLAIHTFSGDKTTMFMVRTTVALVLLAQYWFTLANMSSYNSNRDFPEMLLERRDSDGNLVKSYDVYPNEAHFYFSIPVFMRVNVKEVRNIWGTGWVQDTNKDGEIREDNLQIAAFFGATIDTVRLNGMWFDYGVTVILYVYFNLCNLWILFKPVKITYSDKTKEDLLKLAALQKKYDDEYEGMSEQEIIKMTAKNLKQQYMVTRCFKNASEWIFLYFHLVMIAFTLAVSILSQSILSFGYFVFCMILIQKNKNFFDENESHSTLARQLSHFLLPYLLLDVLLQLVYQTPPELFNIKDSETIDAINQWAIAIGLQQVWINNPQYITLGAENDITLSIEGGLTSLMLKGFTFFFVQIQLSIIRSRSYIKFKEYSIESFNETKEKIGLGMAYRFNNFKNKKVLQQAEDLDKLDQMQTHVKRLIKKRDKLYQLQNGPASNKRISTKHAAEIGSFHKSSSQLKPPVDSKKDLNSIPEIIETFTHESDSIKAESHLDEAEKLEAIEKKDNQEIKVEYEKRIKKLNVCAKLYIRMRHYFVQDLLFRQSDEHLDDIVGQLHDGRTSTKSRIEIGTMLEVRREWFAVKESEYLNKVEQQRQSDSKLKEESAKLSKQTSTNSQKTALELERERDQLESEMSRKTSQIDNIKVDNVEDDVKSEGMAEVEPFDHSASIVTEQEDRVDQMMEKWGEDSLAFEEQVYQMRKAKALESSNKPWEQVNTESYMKVNKMVQRYFILVYRIIMSYSELFCYFWMIIAVISNGGLLYMVFPLSIFGWALMQEHKPGKTFWYFVIFYTQALIVLNFCVQLDVWQVFFEEVLDGKSTEKAAQWILEANLGLGYSSSNEFMDVLAYFFPEIMILLTCMIHIQKEVLAGVFDATVYEYEKFEDGLIRYRLQICEDDEERDQIMRESLHKEALNLPLDDENIDEYRDYEYGSDYDRFELMERKGQTVPGLQTLKMAYDPKKYYALDTFDENGKPRNLSSITPVVTPSQSASDAQMMEDQTFRRQISTRSINKNKRRNLREKAHSVDDIRDYEPPQPNVGFFQSIGNAIKGCWSFALDNSFFRELYPVIKQQKPGTDFYVWICTVEFFLCLYILIFYVNMKEEKTSIAAQFASNQFSPQMVIVLFVMIAIMVFDRVIYGLYILSDVKTTAEDLGTPLQDQNNNALSSRRETARNQHRSRTYSVGSFHAESTHADTKFVMEEHTPDFLDNFDLNLTMESEDVGSKKVYRNSLRPQKTKRSAFRVIKFYYQWVLLILIHWYIFFALPQSYTDCFNNSTLNTSSKSSKDSIELENNNASWKQKASNVSPVNPMSNLNQQLYNEDYGSATAGGGDNPNPDTPSNLNEALKGCNTFTQNTYMVWFYLLFCAYFTLSAFQIRFGMPEYRKGGFMQNRYDKVSSYIFRGWYYIPFIFELRTIIDWTFTSTALDVFEWIKLAQIQADMYVAKCINREYMARKLGTKRERWEKCLIGFMLMLLILFLLAGPIFLFSSINPISVSNPIIGGTMQFNIIIQENLSGKTTIIPIYNSQQTSQVSTLTDEDYSAMNFESSYQTAAFEPSQIQAVQFGSFSDDLWIVNSFKKNFFSEALANPENPNIDFVYQLKMKFIKAGTEGVTSDYFYNKDIPANKTVPEDLAFLNNLHKQVICDPNYGVQGNTFPYTFDLAQKLDNSVYATPLKTDDPYLVGSFALSHQCDPSDPDQIAGNNWLLAAVNQCNAEEYTKPEPEDKTSEEWKQWNECQWLSSEFAFKEELQVGVKGYGLFIFNQSVLPSWLSAYSANLVVFYITIVYVISVSFRSAFVPRTFEIFITDAPFTEDLLMICQSIHIYRVRGELLKEEELYHILLDIMRSPEMIKSVCGSSLKKKLN